MKKKKRSLGPTGVLIKKGNMDTHTHIMGREGSCQSDAINSMTASKPPEAKGEAQNSLPHRSQDFHHTAT